MTTTRDAPDFVDLDEEREVDLRNYWSRLVARWWLPVIGLVAGLIVGYVFTLGGNQVYEATATLYLGQPYSGTALLQGLATNPTYVSQKIKSEAEARKAAAARPSQAGPGEEQRLDADDRRGQGALKAGQTPLVSITLTGSSPKKVAVATTVLGQDVIDQLSGFVNQKIEGFQTLDESYKRQLATNRGRVAAAQAAIKSAGSDVSALDLLVLNSNLDAAIQEQGQLLQAQSAQPAAALAGGERREAAVRRPSGSDEDDRPQHAQLDARRRRDRADHRDHRRARLEPGRPPLQQGVMLEGKTLAVVVPVLQREQLSGRRWPASPSSSTA